MVLPRSFLNLENFSLAFWRIAKSTKLDYKQYYRHIFSSYSLSLSDNLKFLLGDIKRGTYAPRTPTIVFHPKKSGVLRPLTLLSFRDLIVYQAIVNVIAAKMKVEQKKHAYSRCFDAILSNENSHFFFRSWKRSYAAFNNSVKAAFDSGNVYVANFDLVAYYELIDHGILRSCISERVRNEELLNFLFDCLSHWTTNSVGKHLRHGIPQGPEASSFLAECVLFRFDSMIFKETNYARYIDDIKLMAKQEAPLRRALLRLDLKCKELGLVPQAQKINLGKIEHSSQIIKSIPSMIVAKVERKEPGSQSELYKLFRSSIQKQGGQWLISDETTFKYAIMRLNARLDILRRIGPILIHRPDMSSIFSHYLKKFESSKEVADIILDTLKRDPTYDASAADYIGAMDCCEPNTDHREYRRIVSTTRRRSEENSILIRIAVLTFQGRRKGPKDAMRLIQAEPDPRVRNIVLHSLFGQGKDAPYKIANCRELLQREADGEDEDLARYCGLLLILDGFLREEQWTPGRSAHGSIKLLVKGLGIRTRMPSRDSILDGFFAKHRIRVAFSWRKALGKNLRDAEHRSLRLLQLAIGDPTARILMLDTFNEVLVQSFSNSHPSLQTAYIKAAGKNAQPDYGNWLNNGIFKSIMGCCAVDLLIIHDARVKADLAHARSKKGKSTRAISFEDSKKLMDIASRAWVTLVVEWHKIL